MCGGERGVCGFTVLFTALSSHEANCSFNYEPVKHCQASVTSETASRKARITEIDQPQPQPEVNYSYWMPRSHNRTCSYEDEQMLPRSSRG